MVAAIGWTILGGIALFSLVLALITKEVAAHSGNERLIPLHRAMTIAVVPLTVATLLVLAQQYTSLA